MEHHRTRQAPSPPPRKMYRRQNPESDDDDYESVGFADIPASEGPAFVSIGAIQVLSGILMVAFGILGMTHESALSSIGAGLWGGALGAAVGIVGVVAGFKGCYRKADRISPLAVTVYLALCLVSVAVGNLALVLTATGLMRDSQRPKFSFPLKKEAYGYAEIESAGRTNWAPILSNLGLLIVTSVQCIATLVAAFRSYLRVCGCKRRLSKHRSERSSEHYHSSPPTSYYSASSSTGKQTLITRWLGQQSPYPHTHVPRKPAYFVPPANTRCQPIKVGGQLMYPSSNYTSGYSEYSASYAVPPPYRYYAPQPPPWLRTSPKYAGPDESRTNPDGYESFTKIERPKTMEKKRQWSSENENKCDLDIKRSWSVEKDRKMSFCSENSVIDRSYTGQDREVAEEYISVAMHPKR